MRIGIISDTHGFFDPKIPALFAGVEHILHGGDIGPPAIIRELERIAPVTAVLGNNDFSPEFQEFEQVEVGGFRFLLHHIVNPNELSGAIRQQLEQARPHAVIFGHTHKSFSAMKNGVLFLNPGYAGKPRFAAGRSIAVLEARDGKLKADWLPL